MPARIRAAVGEAGGFNAVQKLFTARQSRQAVKAQASHRQSRQAVKAGRTQGGTSLASHHSSWLAPSEPNGDDAIGGPPASSVHD